MAVLPCGFKSRHSHHRFHLGIGLTKPIPRFSFSLKPPSVHCLSIIRSSYPLRSGACPFLAREVKHRRDSVTRPGLRLLEHMTVNGSRSNAPKWSHFLKIIWLALLSGFFALIVFAHLKELLVRQRLFEQLVVDVDLTRSVLGIFINGYVLDYRPTAFENRNKREEYQVGHLD